MFNYTAFTANAFKITPKIPYSKSKDNKTKGNYPFKNYMLDILPTISIIVTDKFLDCLQDFVYKAHNKSTDSRYFSSGVDSAFVQDFLKRYITYETGMGRSIEEVHDFVTAVLGFHDAEVTYDGGVATLYGLFSDLENVANKPALEYVSSQETDEAMSGGEFTTRILKNLPILRQCLLSQTLLKREWALQWYTFAMYIMQPTSLMRMVSVLFYVMYAMYDYMDDMESLFRFDSEMPESAWLTFLWRYWLNTSVKKVYRDFDVSKYIDFDDNFVTMREKLGYTDDNYNYLLASYNTADTDFPLFVLLELTRWYHFWYNTLEREYVDVYADFGKTLNALYECVKLADLQIDPLGELKQVERQQKSKAAHTHGSLNVTNLQAMQGAFNTVSGETEMSLSPTNSVGLRSSKPDNAENEGIEWSWLDPSVESLKLAGTPLDWDDSDDANIAYFCMYYVSKRFLMSVEDAYKAIILPLSSYSHVHLFSERILPTVALLELENNINSKKVDKLTEQVNSLKEENDGLKFASMHRTRDDKLKAFYDNAMENSDATITALEMEQERLREHIAYLESCITDKSVITEAEETFEVLTTEKKIEELRKFGKKICVVGAHSINNLDDLTKGVVRQLVSENLPKLQKSLLTNKGSWDYVFLNTRAMSHSFYYTVKDGLRASSAQVVSLGVTNARAVVDAVYSAVIG